MVTGGTNASIMDSNMDSTVDLTAAERLNADLTGVFAAAANL